MKLLRRLEAERSCLCEIIYGKSIYLCSFKGKYFINAFDAFVMRRNGARALRYSASMTAVGCVGAVKVLKHP